jgi:hypothetical protein
MAAALTRGEHLDVMREANGSGKHLLQTGTVSQHNVSSGSQADRRRALELCQRAGHGLTGNRQIIGNVLATHWQSNFVAELNALPHLKQEGGHPFRGALVEQEQMALRTVKLVSRMCP